MNLAKIQEILEKAPAKISFYVENEITEYQSMQTFHETYRQNRAKKYLELKARGETISIASPPTSFPQMSQVNLSIVF